MRVCEVFNTDTMVTSNIKYKVFVIRRHNTECHFNLKINPLNPKPLVLGWWWLLNPSYLVLVALVANASNLRRPFFTALMGLKHA